MFAVINSANAAEASVKINYRLKWLFNASVVGDLYADVNNYFSTEGLDVKIKEGGPERDAIRELELGYAQFGVASADQVIRALSKGA
ncbi:MAG: ABC transporter substrate-binding protein, partial [Deltaproteobacteria bacterium]|nr:ABC transporter substrate-binding protein [Deltaproteobacteria bacterium]